jgi:hypothetical protein
VAGHISYPRTEEAESAWNDYRDAVTLANAGSREAAVALLQDIINNPNTPAELKQLAAKLLAQLLGVESAEDIASFAPEAPLPEEPPPRPTRGKVTPTGPIGGRPSGRPTHINPRDDAATQRSLRGENEAAETLAINGYRVEQNPPRQPNGKMPDYRIEGEIFDCYTPRAGKPPRGVSSEAEGKVKDGQAERVVLNLNDWDGDIAELRDQFRNYPVPGLKEVLVVRNGQVFDIL